MKHIHTPLDEVTLLSLKAGEQVLISGSLYTARDAAHKRICSMFEQNQNIPLSLNGEIIFYAGPAPTPPGKAIGSIGPTTSYRMDPYTPLVLEKLGVKALIGKGARNESVVKALKSNNAVYFVAIGGIAALLSRKIKKSEVVLFPELGPEAIHRLEIEEFPAIVAIDLHGGNVFDHY